MMKKIRKIYFETMETIRYYGWFSFLLVLLLLFVTFMFFNYVKSQKQYLVLEESSVATQDINILSYHISQLIGTAHNDMHIIKGSNEADKYLFDHTPENLAEFESLVYRVATNKPEFISIALVDLTGQELFKVSRTNGHLFKNDDLSNVDLDKYFLGSASGTDKLGYISEIQLLDGSPIIQMAQKLYVNGLVDSYIILSYNANQFLSIFDVYATESSGNFSLGLINENNIWLINPETIGLDLVIDVDLENEIIEDVSEEDNALTASVILDLGIYDHTGLDKDFFTIFAIVDVEAAIQTSNQFFAIHSWLIYVIDSILLFLLLFIGHLLNNKNKDKILLNANMYLSDKNKDAVLIADGNYKTEYINQSLTDYLGYDSNEMVGVNPSELLKPVFCEAPFNPQGIDEAYQGHVWNKTKEGIYFLSYLRVKKESSSHSKVKHFISIYSNPVLNFNDIDISSLSRYVDVIAPVFEQFGLIENKTILMLLKVSNIDAYDFSIFINQYAHHELKVMLAHSFYIFIYANLDNNSINHSMIEIDRLINLYRNQPDVSLNFKHFYSVVQVNEQSNTIRKMVEASFIGLKANKQDSQNVHQIFDSGMIEQVTRGNLVRDALKRGFENNEFYMSYQLIKDTKKDRLNGVEALLRWKNIDLGQIRPDEFIPVIENSHYISQLTIMVLKNVIKDFTPYCDVLPRDFKISINVTYFDFVNDYIIDELIHMIDKSKLNNSLFLFEITENHYIDRIASTNQIIERLHKNNILVGIDDFGTGYSSISSIKHIEVDYVKIDRIFMMNYPNKDDGTMFVSMANLIRNLEKPIVVEGIETEEQLQFSTKQLCRYAQGYFIAKPESINKVIKRLKMQGESI